MKNSLATMGDISRITLGMYQDKTKNGAPAQPASVKSYPSKEELRSLVRKTAGDSPSLHTYIGRNDFIPLVNDLARMQSLSRTNPEITGTAESVLDREIWTFTSPKGECFATVSALETPAMLSQFIKKNGLTRADHEII